MFHDPHNTFRAADALEFAAVYTQAVKQTPDEIRLRLADLSGRIELAQSRQQPINLLLAGYRALESMLVFHEQQILPTIIKLDDTDPTPCR